MSNKKKFLKDIKNNLNKESEDFKKEVEELKNEFLLVDLFKVIVVISVGLCLFFGFKIYKDNIILNDLKHELSIKQEKYESIKKENELIEKKNQKEELKSIDYNLIENSKKILNGLFDFKSTDDYYYQRQKLSKEYPMLKENKYLDMNGYNIGHGNKQIESKVLSVKNFCGEEKDEISYIVEQNLNMKDTGVFYDKYWFISFKGKNKNDLKVMDYYPLVEYKK